MWILKLFEKYNNNVIRHSHHPYSFCLFHIRCFQSKRRTPQLTSMDTMLTSANGNNLTQLGPTGSPQSPNLSSSSFNEVINYCDKVSRHQTTICHGINTLMTYVGHTLPEGAGHSKPHTASHTKHILNS